jgi:tetratricopeptide (TPR) repeat protein
MHEQDIRLHEMYLHELETKKAHFGAAYCPTHILVEIEFLKRRIQELGSAAKDDIDLSHNLPYETDLIGRNEEISQIVRKIEANNILMIVGGPGVGKTSLAINIAYTLLRDRYFDRAVWISARDREISLNDVLDEISRVNMRPDILSMSPGEKLHEILFLLRRSKCLLLIDNLEGISDENVLSFASQIPPPSKIIFTSRINRKISNQRLEAFKLNGLMIEAVQKLIEREITNSAREHVAQIGPSLLDEIYKATGGIPLVVKWLVGQTEETARSLIEVIAELREGKGEILPYLYGKITADLDIETHALLVIMSILSDNTTRDDLRAILKLEVEQINKSVRTLVSRSLIDTHLTEALNRAEYSVHPLTRAYTVNTPKSKYGLIKLRNSVIEYYKAFVFQECNSVYKFDHKVLRSSIKNIILVAEYCYEHERIDDFLAFHKIYYFLGEQGFWTQRTLLAERVIEMARKVERIDVLALALSDNWGWLLIQRELYDEAHKANIEALQIFREVADTYGLANTLRNIGLIKREKGEIDEARQLFEQALEMALSNDHYKVSGDTFVSLGSMSRDNGNIDDALIFYNKSLTYYRLDEYETGVGWALGNLGHLARLQGRYDDAKELYTSALERFERYGRMDRIAAIHEGMALLEKDSNNQPGVYVNAAAAEEIYRKLGMIPKAQKVRELKLEAKVTS